MRIHKAEAVIIKRRNIGEADKLLTILTRDGKLVVKAPGIRKIASKRSPHLELLNRSMITLYRKSDIPIVSEADMISDYAVIKADLTKIGVSFHICELIDGLCPENEECEDVFNLLVHTLGQLCQAEDPHMLVHAFELRLLELLGFANQRMWAHTQFDTQAYVESIIERKLKAKEIFLFNS